jgi:hypothetical protein
VNDMRRLRLLGLAVFAVLAFGAVAAASSASALESVWLVNGARAEVRELVLSEAELTLLNEGGGIIPKIALLCSGLDEGWVGPGSLDEITLIMSLGEVESVENWILCTPQEGCETSTPSVWVRPVGLPWETELLLTLSGTEEIYLNDILGLNGEAGWQVKECLLFGTAHEDKCVTNQSSADIDNNVTEGDVVALFGPAPMGHNALCESTGAETGVVDGEVLIFPESGSLAVSEG